MSLIYGHRGASGYAPENTLEAFLLSMEMGADGFELDVHMSLDGELVVIHDETLDRTTNGTGLNGTPCTYRYVRYDGIWGWANASFLY